MSEFGTNFRKRREALGISLDDIANETRISIRFLQAIESEEFQRLPGGVFNRGFIRNFAERVGIDPNQAVADYERIVRSNDPEEDAVSTPNANGNTRSLLYPAAFLVLVALVIGIVVVKRNFPAGAPMPAASTSAPPLVANTSPTIPSVETTVSAAAEPTPPPPIVEEQLAIEISAHEATWIKVATDGANPTETVLQPGATQRFTAQTSVDVTIGNAGGVSMKVNDRNIDSLGKSGQVRSLVITSENAETIS